MSQFIAFSALPEGLPTNPLVQRIEQLPITAPVAQLYFSDLKQVYWVSSVDAWFIEASRLISEGAPFTSTILGSFIVALLGSNARIAIWYSDEWDDLPRADSKLSLLHEMEQQIMEAPGEVWVLYDEST